MPQTQHLTMPICNFYRYLTSEDVAPHEKISIVKSTIFNNDIGLNKYPNPIVEPLISVKKSRNQLWTLKKNKEVITESKKLIELHVRPKKRKTKH